MDLWHPRANQLIPRFVSGGLYAEGFPYRQVLHTTESPGTYWPSTDGYYGGSDRQFWPHATLHKGDGNQPASITQHLPIDRSAYALEHRTGTIETNRACAVQIEIAWQAANAADMPVDLVVCVADWVTWVAAQTGSSLAVAGWHSYPPEDGWSLGYEPWRMSDDEWRTFSGVCGHQHVPHNVHGDPGRLPISFDGTPPSPPEVDVTPDQAQTLMDAFGAAKDAHEYARRAQADIDQCITEMRAAFALLNARIDRMGGATTGTLHVSGDLQVT